MSTTPSRMRLHPVNPAEAVLAAFFDPGLSPLDEWKLSAGPGTKGLRRLHNYTICWGWDSAEPGKPAFRWSWEGSVDVSGHDGMFVQAAFPSTTTMTLTARLDGRWQTIVTAKGCDTHDDYSGPFSGSRLEALRIEVTPATAAPGAFASFYLGVHDARRLADWIAYENPTVYPSEWPEFIKPESEWGAYAPEMGLSLEAAELEGLRRKIGRPPYRGLADALRAEVRASLAEKPETMIRRYVPCGPKPYAYSARERDRGIPLWSVMDQCAFFGMVDRDSALVRMAARYLVSMVHSKLWTESFVEHDFPGSAMNWRSFYQNLACLAAVNALDWIGFALTDHAKEVIRHDVFFKALAPLEYDFVRNEYIYQMNQAVVFSFGRIAALLALNKEWPRAGARIDLARRDLDETAHRIISADGGYGEGPGYYTGVMFYMLGSYLFLARHLGVAPETLVPPGALKGADYFGTFVSTAGAAARIPLSDGPGTELPTDWIAMFARVTGDPRWKGFLASRLESDMAPLFAGVANRVWRGSGVRTLVYGPEDLSAREPIVPRFRIHADSGHATCRRQSDIGVVRLHVSGASAQEGHSHADKGAIVLEAAGLTLLTDRGTPVYSDPITSIIKETRWHNALTVEAPDGSELSQVNPCPAAVCPTGSGDEHALSLRVDLTPAWGEPVKSMVRSVDSPDPLHFTLRDEVRLSTERRVVFHLNSHYPVTVEPGGTSALFVSPACRLRVSWKWKGEVVHAGKDLPDGEHRTVYGLAVRSAPRATHDLETLLELAPG